MTEETNNDIHSYFETIGISGSENWYSDTYDYAIGNNVQSIAEGGK